MKRIVIGLLALMFMTTAVVWAADATGVWKASVPGRDGTAREMVFKLKADGDKLTGTLSGARGETEIQDGRVSGDTITFKIQREFNGNTMVILYEGKVQGDQIQFKSKRQDGDRPAMEFTAQREK